MAPQSAEFDPPARFYRFGDFEVDLNEETLRSGGERLNINHRMFQVLCLLIERKGEVVNKNEFFERVWGGSFVEDNNLTVTITALRKVLGDSAKQARFIENIPRKGYRFVAPVSIEPSLMLDKAEARPQPTAVSRSNARRASRFGIAAVSVCVVVALVMVAAGYKGFWTPHASFTDRIDSIAVLPFENRTAESEYLADGLTDGIISNLSRQSRMRVIDRDSTHKFKNTVSDPTAAGRELNVRAIVTGQIEQDGDSIIVNAALFDLAKNSQIWRLQFRRKGNDLFAAQQEISQAIIQHIAPGTTGQEVHSSKRYSSDPVAYDLYLKGRYHWNKRTIADFQQAVELFREAIDRDPTFAKAYIGLADAYTLGDFLYLNLSPEEKNALVRGAIQKALEIDDSLGEAYTSLAINKCYYDWDLSGAERDYRRALELSPNDATAHHWYAEFLSMQGRFDESIAEYDRAISLDPLSLPIKTDKSMSYYYARDYDTAIELLSKNMELNPSYERTYESLFFVQRQKGMFNNAVDMGEKLVALQFQRSERSPQSLEQMKLLTAKLRIGLTNSGSEGYWNAELKYGDQTSMSRAIAFAKLGKADKAFDHLETAFKERNSGMVWLKVLPELDGIRSDPRYQDLMRRVGFSN